VKELKPRITQLLIFQLFFFIGFIFLTFLILQILKGESKKDPLSVMMAGVGCLLIFGLFIVLSASYLYVDLTQKVYLDEYNCQIVVKKNISSLTISAQDIVESYHVKVLDPFRQRFPLNAYEYIVLALKERAKIYITNLLINPEQISKCLNIKYKLIITRIPFIDWRIRQGILKSDEFEQKVTEFLERFKDYPTSQLAEILSQKSTYADYAREVASRLMNARKVKSSAGYISVKNIN
jgi:hypothetical protein